MLYIFIRKNKYEKRGTNVLTLTLEILFLTCFQNGMNKKKQANSR
jgi:hypothetical protein